LQMSATYSLNLKGDGPAGREWFDKLTTNG